MSQPVKLSDALVLDARLAGEVQERSIAGQVEFWAKLGQSIDLLLKGKQAIALRQSGQKELLSERLASVDSPAGRARVEAYLRTRPYPHYQEDVDPGFLLRIDEDGTRTVGRFVNRVFVAKEAEPKLGGKGKVLAAKPAPRGKTKAPARSSPRAAKAGVSPRRKQSAV